MHFLWKNLHRPYTLLFRTQDGAFFSSCLLYLEYSFTVRQPRHNAHYVGSAMISVQKWRKDWMNHVVQKAFRVQSGMPELWDALTHIHVMDASSWRVCITVCFGSHVNKLTHFIGKDTLLSHDGTLSSDFMTNCFRAHHRHSICTKVYQTKQHKCPWALTCINTTHKLGIFHVSCEASES